MVFYFSYILERLGFKKHVNNKKVTKLVKLISISVETLTCEILINPAKTTQIKLTYFITIKKIPIMDGSKSGHNEQ